MSNFTYDGHGVPTPIPPKPTTSLKDFRICTIECPNWEVFKELKFFQSQNPVPTMGNFPEYLEYRMAFARYVRSVVEIVRKHVDVPHFGSEGSIYRKFGLVFDIYENVEIHYAHVNNGIENVIELVKIMAKQEATNDPAA